MKKKILIFSLLFIMLSGALTVNAGGIYIYAPLDSGEQHSRSYRIDEENLQSWLDQGWYTYETRYLYSLDGRKIAVALNAVEAYKLVGWYEEPVCMIYAPDGRKAIISTAELGNYQSVGWYAYPVDYIFNAYGNPIVVSKADKAYYVGQGYYDKYEDTLVTIYASDGRSAKIPVGWRTEYESVGWYSSEDEALAHAFYIGQSVYERCKSISYGRRGTITQIADNGKLCIQWTHFYNLYSNETISDLALIARLRQRNNAVIETEVGDICIELYPEAAPITVANFRKLVGQGFYDGLTFHRVVDGFIIQGGDPLGNGTGGSKDKIMGEFEENGVYNPISHQRGVISMARASNPNSASSQFFIMHKGATYLDGQYAAFGRVTNGMEVVDRIVQVSIVEDGIGTVKPANQMRINRIYFENDIFNIQLGEQYWYRANDVRDNMQY